jgi:hypothetical protein
LYPQTKKMAYRDINISKQAAPKENLTPVFSEFIGETKGQGKIDNFVDDSKSNLKMSSSIKLDTHEVKFNGDLSKLLNLFESETDERKRWLTIMGLIERKILQLRCYKNPTLAFSIQSQKSGDNYFSYIVIRAVFFDLYTGKKEIRRYFNKMEDYEYNSLEELKSDTSFMNEALIEIKSIMADLINKEDITIEYLESQLKSLALETFELYRVSKEIALHKKNQDAAINSKMEQENKISQELEEEEERYQKEIRAIKGANEDASYKEIMLIKEKDNHLFNMRRIKEKGKLNF